MSIVKDLNLAEVGKKNLEWAESRMPVLMQIRKEFEKEKPFKGLKISACLHVTKETGVLMRTLKAGGAEVALCASNPLSTQDDIAAALATEGISTFAIYGMDSKKYYECLNACLDIQPNITIDDGADLINVIHNARQDLLKGIIAGQEETTTGVIRLKAMEKAGALKYSVIAVNDTPTKHLFDNVYGTGQSTLDGIIRATNAMVAGSTFVVVGYGHCGKGVAKGADGMGAKVVIVEVDPVEALKAWLDGFQVMTMKDAAKTGDIFVTVTGNKNVIRGEHFKEMKDNAIVCNSGHFNAELELSWIEKNASSKKEVKDDVMQYVINGRKLNVLGEGRLVNLACAEGHPSDVMDMSFADQALCAEWIAKNRDKLKNVKVYDVPSEIDSKVARLKLKSHGIEIETLTEEQKKYLQSYNEGT